MRKRILLIISNYCTKPYPVFPLGVAHIAAALKREGHTVKIIDVLGASWDNLEDALKSFKPDYIGISQRNIDDLNIQGSVVYSDSLGPMITRLRKVSSAPVILGGSGFSLFPRELLERTGADFGVQGEGDRALPRLISALQGAGKLANIAGLVYRHEGKVLINKQKPCPPMDIPAAFRPRSLCQWYLRRSLMLNIQTQRGCPFRCCYCTYPVIEGKKLRRRDYGELCGELHQMEKTGCAYFFIVDSVFNTSNDHVAALCETMLKRAMKMSWGCFLRPAGITAELMRLMARAGLTHVEFGSDSLCDPVLDAYGKGFTFDDIYAASESARLAKVHYAHFLIAGGPGETESTLREGYENSKRLRKTVYFPFVGMRLYPGTPLHSIACREGVLRKNADLFAPRFYLSPRITREKIFAILRSCHRQSPNWIVDGIPPSIENVVRGLRAKGVTGPLWEFQAR